MSTVTSRPTPAETTAQDTLRWGAVHLDVIDVDQSVAFWNGLIGLTVLGRDGDTARLGVEDAELVVLHGGATQFPARGRTGLYHLAVHLPSEAEFARVLARLFSQRYPHAPTDHVMHWATYLDDPNGINVELTFETLDRFGGYDTSGRQGFAIFGSDGKPRDGIAPLDLEEVLSHLPDRDFAAPMPAGARIGHIHLHVGDLAEAQEFYADLGFTPNAPLGSFGMADMAAGGSFPHRLAYNVWQGRGAPPTPPGTAGLRFAELHTDGREPGLVSDPSGNRIQLV
jgi:catechol 2,3-dioxygenase